jgi:hypothetical protein
MRTLYDPYCWKLLDELTSHHASDKNTGQRVGNSLTRDESQRWPIQRSQSLTRGSYLESCAGLLCSDSRSLVSRVRNLGV